MAAAIIVLKLSFMFLPNLLYKLCFVRDYTSTTTTIQMIIVFILIYIDESKYQSTDANMLFNLGIIGKFLECVALVIRRTV